MRLKATNRGGGAGVSLPLQHQPHERKENNLDQQNNFVNKIPGLSKHEALKKAPVNPIRPTFYSA
jgi:hypothetical protein